MQGIFVDIESNGLDCFSHKVIEVAFKMVRLETGEIEASFETPVNVDEQEWKRSDPKSLEVNGWKEYSLLKTAPSRWEVGKKIQRLFQSKGVHRDQSVFICQNPSFDRPFFAQLVDTYIQEKFHWPYHWLDLASMFWACQAKSLGLPPLNRLSKDHIAKELQIPKEAFPHKAMAGVEHLMACYEKLIGFPAKQMRQVLQPGMAGTGVAGMEITSERKPL